MGAGTQLGDGVRADAELIAASRTGDAASFGALYERHAGAAWVVARQYTDSRADADDVVADAFTAVHGALLRGNGPESAFRAYLFTVVRRTAADRREKAHRVQPTDDLATLERGTALAGTAEEPALEGFERGVVARAFHSLPERWQAVLWHSEVEGLTPAQIAPVLGLTANGVAALAYRAREGLRQAYLQQHLQDPLDESCRTVAGKLGAYVRGGLGTRENAQVDKHLDGCGDCRALVLELGDVNHGMRAVVAPLVLGVVGLGALAHLLPVGGGLAAGAASAAAGGGGAGAGSAGAGSAGAGSAGSAGAGSAGVAGGAGAGGAGAGGAAGAAATGATAVATGTTAAVGVGAGGAAAAGGMAALLGTIPLGVAAVAAGAVAVAAVAAVSVYGLMSDEDPSAASSPSPSTSTSAPDETPTPTPQPSVAEPTPSATPTPSPTDLPDLGALLADEAEAEAESEDGVDDVDGGDVTPPDEEPSTEVPGEEPTDAPTEPAPPAVSIDVPADGLALAAGLTGQELAFGIRNSGGTVVTDLAADVTLPPGVTVDGIAAATLRGLDAGGFSVMVAPGWVCDGAQTVVHCTLDSLAPATVSQLVLRVSIDESFDGEETHVGLQVVGQGVEYKAPRIPVRVHASPARLALRSTPAPLTLVSGRTTQLDLDLANVGGSPLGSSPATATFRLPTGVAAAVVPGSPWACADGPGGTTTCSLDRLAPRAAAPLSLHLTAGEPGDVGQRTLRLDLRPTGTRSPEPLDLPFDVLRPARLAVGGDTATTVARGRAAATAVTVANTGDLPANGLVAHLTRPAGTTWPATPVEGWSCGGTDTPQLTCTRDALPGGQSAALAVRLSPEAGSVGPLGDLLVRVEAPDADPAPEHRVAVTAVAPVLGVTRPSVLLAAATGTGTVSFAVSAGGGDLAADAEDVVATLDLPSGLTLDPEGRGPTAGECSAVYPRGVHCQLGTIPAGSTAEVLVNARWSGGNREPVVVAQASAPGAAPVTSEPGTVSWTGISPRLRVDGGWAVTEVGAPLLTCPPTQATCAAALQHGNRDNNSLDMVPLDEAPDLPGASGERAAVPVSSATSLDVPAGRQIEFAGLYWSANTGPYDRWSGDLATVRLRGPDSAYQTLHADAENVREVVDNGGRRYYQAFVDVTGLVAAAGGGTWSVADAAVSQTRRDPSPSYYAGWSLVVVYADPSSDATITVYDGAGWIGGSSTHPLLEFPARADQHARIGVVAWEGDRTAVGDRLLLDGDRPLAPEAWAGTAPAGGVDNAFDSSARGWRWPNSLGTDAKGFALPPLAQGIRSLGATTVSDQYLVGVVTLRTDRASTS